MTIRAALAPLNPPIALIRAVERIGRRLHLVYLTDLLQTGTRHYKPLDELLRHREGRKSRAAKIAVTMVLEALAGTLGTQPPRLADTFDLDFVATSARASPYTDTPPTPMPTPHASPQPAHLYGRPEPERRLPPTNVYTDGSYRRTSSGQWGAGFAAYVESGPYTKTPRSHYSLRTGPHTLPLEDSSTPDGLVSGAIHGSIAPDLKSYGGELMGIGAAPFIAPPGAPLHIHTDNMAAKWAIESFTKKTRRAQLKLQHHNILRGVVALLQTRDVTIHWVRAHVGYTGNEIADEMAKDGAELPAARTFTGQHDQCLDFFQRYIEDCALPLQVALHPAEVLSATGGLQYTTQLLQEEYVPGQEQVATGNIKKFFRKHAFHPHAAALFRLTSFRGAMWEDAQKTKGVDAAQWGRALKGKLHSLHTNKVEAYALKLATNSTTSHVTLAHRHQPWYRHLTGAATDFSHPSGADRSDFYEAFTDSMRPLCPLCQQPMREGQLFNPLLHVLQQCTHPDISRAARELLGNLGSRLMALGAPQWWQADPTLALPKAHEMASPRGGRLSSLFWSECKKVLSLPAQQDLPSAAPIIGLGVIHAKNEGLREWVTLFHSHVQHKAVLFILGPLPPALATCLSTHPPTHNSTLPPRSLPIPHLELLHGGQGLTRGYRSLYSGRVTVLSWRIPLNTDLAQTLPTLLDPAGPPPSLPNEQDHQIEPDGNLHLSPQAAVEVGHALRWFPVPPPVRGQQPTYPSAQAPPTIKLPPRLRALGKNLNDAPPEVMLRGDPPTLQGLLNFMHVPAGDQQQAQDHLYRMWLIDLKNIHHIFLRHLDQYAATHNLPPSLLIG